MPLPEMKKVERVVDGAKFTEINSDQARKFRNAMGGKNTGPKNKRSRMENPYDSYSYGSSPEGDKKYRELAAKQDAANRKGPAAVKKRAAEVREEKAQYAALHNFDNNEDDWPWPRLSRKPQTARNTLRLALP